MDKQGSISERGSSATGLTAPNFDKGDKMRERSRGLQHHCWSLSTLRKCTLLLFAVENDIFSMSIDIF
jgi:hypothetical protein